MKKNSSGLFHPTMVLKGTGLIIERVMVKTTTRYHDIKVVSLINLGEIMSKCQCDKLEWKEEGDHWPSEVWKCVNCDALWSVELIRDFKNKEKIE